MAAHFLEWLQFAVRWLHVVAAIAWVGASFYFIWVENALSRSGRQRLPNLAGHLWSVHGGGFYYLEKYQGAPDELPATLHWFKWDAYVAWLSGAALLILIYYINAGAWLAAAGADPNTAIAVSVALLLGGWLGYDGLCRTPLLSRPLWFAVLALLVGGALLHVVDDVLSPRAAFLHVGAMMGTVMAGNVFFIIIPSQKALVAAFAAGRPPDTALGRRAALRSLHNNYLALPAIFLMISAHYPLLYQHPRAPYIFIALSLAGGFIRHFINRRHRGMTQWFWLPAAFVAFVAAAFLSLPNYGGVSGGEVTTAELRPLIKRHCAGCHSATPTDTIFRIAPLGLKLDTEAEIIAAADAIYQRSVIDRSMPFNNQTGMTEKEREQIAAWHKFLPSP